MARADATRDGDARGGRVERLIESFERELEEEKIFGQASVTVAPLPRGTGFRFALSAEARALPFLKGETLEMASAGARDAHRGLVDGQRGEGVGRGRGVGEIAADGAPVLDLRGPDRGAGRAKKGEMRFDERVGA